MQKQTLRGRSARTSIHRHDALAGGLVQVDLSGNRELDFPSELACELIQ
jgi:hypothetical protein